ncbi:MAG: GFA family protein [SAR324 cluster bacterium]|nr:GFA family protein [SAR324 cluster bacterium]
MPVLRPSLFSKEEQFTLHSGSPQAFQHQSESGNTMTKEFCPKCGSTVFGSNSGRPGIKSVHIGSLEDASFVEPNFNVWTCRQLPYTLIDESLNNFPKGPQKM